MGKVLVVSDSHGLNSELAEIKKRHGDEVGLMIHCGDSELFLEDEAIKNFLVVRGNCDDETRFKNDLIEDYAGIRFFVTHGHHYSVKKSLLGLLYRAEEENANIVCFGHSHVLGAEMVRNTLFVNPGSLRQPRGRIERTYCILDLSGDKVDLQVFDYYKGELTDLRKTFRFSKEQF